MITDSALAAFKAAAGISTVSLSVFIRTSLLMGFLLWAAWCVLELMKYYQSQRSENISSLLLDYVKIFFLVSIVVSLVFIA